MGTSLKDAGSENYSKSPLVLDYPGFSRTGRQVVSGAMTVL